MYPTVELHSAKTVINPLYSRAMAETAVKLRGIKQSHEIGLLMGCPVHFTNVEAIELWIQAYLTEYPDQVNFNRGVYPALVKYLRRCEQDFLAMN